MSSGCPPQLQLTIQPNTTSFKRSFEQFGFDLASPVDGSSQGSSNDRNDRNKRARSETSFSESTDSTDSSRSSSLLVSGSSNSLSPPRVEDHLSVTGSSSETSLGPPRLPTPDIEDIEMPDYPAEERNSIDTLSSQVHQNEERYRLSLGSLNTFVSEGAVLQHNPRSSSPRLPTPPPVLPPLGISESQQRLSISSNAFLQPPTRPASPIPVEVLFGAESPSSTIQSAPTEDSELMQGFRARLTGALERLVPQSPLVPGLELDEQDEQLPSRNGVRLQETTSIEVPQDPPTLPPIPSITTTTDIDHFNIDNLLSGEESAQSRTTMPSTSSSSISPTLDGHPLPSPILRDLHSWMEEDRHLAHDFADPSYPYHWRPHQPIPTSHASTSRPSASRTRTDSGANGGLFGSNGRPHDRPAGEQTQQSSNQPHEMGLWDRSSLETLNGSNNDGANNFPHAQLSVLGRSSSPDSAVLDRSTRLQSELRYRSRLLSSISLVSENSLEARRIADYDHVIRDLYTVRRRMDGRDVEPVDNPPSATNHEETRSRPRLSGHDVERQIPSFVLQLPPLPTPTLGVPPDAREEGEIPFEGDSVGPPMPWIYAPPFSGSTEWGHHLERERREQTRRSFPPSLMSSHPETGHPFNTSRHPPPPRPPSPQLSPVGMAFPAPAHNPSWETHTLNNIRSERPHVQLTRPSVHQEPPPSLPPPDFGQAFETGRHDRDLEMRVTPQTQEHVPRRYSGPTPSFMYTHLQPRPHREENLQTHAWHPHANQNRIPQFQQPSSVTPTDAPQYLQQSIPRTAQAGHIIHQEIPPTRRQETVDHRRMLRYSLPVTEDGDGSSSSPGSSISMGDNSSRLSLNVSNDSGPYQASSMQPPDYAERSVYDLRPRNEYRRVVSSYPPAVLDPTAYAPGPFRNTINQALNHRMNRPSPPIIPPLPFQEPPPAATESAATSSRSGEAVPPRSFVHREESPDRAFGFAPRPAAQNMGQQRPLPSFAPTPPRPFVHSHDNLTENYRYSTLHRHLSRYVRMEPSRIEPHIFSEEPTSNVPNPIDPSPQHVLPPRINPIRPDGVNMTRQLQIINHHRQHEAERRRRNSIVETARAEATQPESNSRPPPRRFGDLESWRSRARGRLRLVPDILTASRMRPGNLGDFVHDDDFDDSYETLVNLAATLGDVKSKSTPLEILEKLEKGSFKEWKSDDGDKRCPICLDDYVDHDILLKLNNCNHWFHQGCLQQWLHTANTCPVCRKTVHHSESSSTSPRRSARRFGFWRNGPPHSPGGGGGGGGGESGPSSSNRPGPPGNSSGASGRWSYHMRRRAFE